LDWAAFGVMTLPSIGIPLLLWYSSKRKYDSPKSKKNWDINYRTKTDQGSLSECGGRGVLRIMVGLKCFWIHLITHIGVNGQWFNLFLSNVLHQIGDRSIK